jgi:hypothetical protein
VHPGGLAGAVPVEVAPGARPAAGSGRRAGWAA